MPFIKGRYHINPAMGEALEAARMAEAAMRLASLSRGSNATEGPLFFDDDSSDQADGFASPHADDAPEPGPIHRIEIDLEGLPGRRNERAPEASARGAREIIEPGRSDTVPVSTGRATRGFVARIHRAAPTVSDVIPRSPDAVGATRNPSSTAVREIPHSVRDDSSQMGRLLPPETHVFSDHRDLLDFLRDQLTIRPGSSS